MTQHYSDPKRAGDPQALPDLETFYRDSCFVRFGLHGDCGRTYDTCPHVGWYWRRETCEHCDGPMHPGLDCGGTTAPEGVQDAPVYGDPNGPFATEAEALANAREGMEE